MDKTRLGTCHFVSETAAVTYYAPYYTDRITAARAVSQKIREKEIKIGPPTVDVELGERVVLIDNGTRYAIEANQIQKKPPAPSVKTRGRVCQFSPCNYPHCGCI